MAEDELKMKRPSFQFYPGDWRRDSALQSCSIAARGLWIELMCVMHECERYGTLSVNGQSMSTGQLARLAGETEKVIKGLLAELETAGVFSRDESGIIFSRRMVADETTREARAKHGPKGAEHGHKGAVHGSKGGRPRKETGDTKTPLKTPLAADENPPPSSSSSLSENNKPPVGPPSPETLTAPPDGVAQPIDLLGDQPKARGGRERGTKLPADWHPGAELMELARGWDLDPDWELQKFRDHWHGASGAKACKSDWAATWRNWCRKSLEMRPGRKPVNPHQNQAFIDGFKEKYRDD